MNKLISEQGVDSVKFELHNEDGTVLPAKVLHTHAPENCDCLHQMLSGNLTKVSEGVWQKV